jgi:hypothetical protein
MSQGCPTPEFGMGLVRHVLDLYAGHGAILAPQTSNRKRVPQTWDVMGMAISSDRSERFGAYAESEIRIEHPIAGSLHVRPLRDGTTVGAFPEPTGSTIYVITAHNPGRHWSDAENAARHRQLQRRLAELRGVQLWPAVGGDVEWTHTEESIAVVGLTDEQAIALGADFEQEAVFAWTPQNLAVLPCDGSAALVRGWSVT